VVAKAKHAAPEAQAALAREGVLRIVLRVGIQHCIEGAQEDVVRQIEDETWAESEEKDRAAREAQDW
jgi:hypothetical protein